MAEGSLGQRFTAFRPSKTVWFWSTLASVIAVVVVGFTWGGWVTGGTAADRASAAARQATARLAADICAFRFLAAPDASTQLTALNKESSYQRGSMLEKGGWVTFAGADKAVDGASSLCADKLADAKLPVNGPVAEAATTTD